MTFPKKIREQVYNKYDGHCAYCGRKIEYKDMQIDHFIPQRRWNTERSNDINNLMPSCRSCNHYKRAHSLETFRRYIFEIPKKLKENYIYKIGLIYGNVIENKHPIKFYYEECEEKKHHDFNRVKKRLLIVTVKINIQKRIIYYKAQGTYCCTTCQHPMKKTEAKNNNYCPYCGQKLSGEILLI